VTLLSYGGVMAHKTGDASVPHHTTREWDGVESGQRGLHTFFETDLVDELEWGLGKKVFLKGKDLFKKESKYAKSLPNLHLRVQKLYPKLEDSNRITGLILALIEDSYLHIENVRHFDIQFGIATLEEALRMEKCQRLPAVKRLRKELKNTKDKHKRKILLATKVTAVKSELGNRNNFPCRRKPDARVSEDGLKLSKGQPKIAERFEPLIVDRLAIAAAVTADIWVGLWVQGKLPRLCWTWKYSIKPGFISPTDKTCFGYALKDEPKNFLRENGTSALPWKKSARQLEQCLQLE